MYILKDKLVTIDSNNSLCNQAGLCFVLTGKMNEIAKEMNDKILYVPTEDKLAEYVTAIKGKQLGLRLDNPRWDDNYTAIIGDFWVSGKGTKCFRPLATGSHYYIMQEWEGLKDTDLDLEDSRDSYTYYQNSKSGSGRSGTIHVVIHRVQLCQTN